ncbi:hypothetical protein ScalyP_jg7756, partial [Parmales sp. scaly parma]
LPATTTTSEETSVGPSSQADNNNKKSTSLIHAIAMAGVTFGLASLLTLLQVLRKSNILPKHCNLFNWSRRPSEKNNTIPLPHVTYNFPESRRAKPGRQHNINFRLASFFTVVFLLGSVVRPSAGVATRTTAFAAKAKAINSNSNSNINSNSDLGGARVVGGDEDGAVLLPGREEFKMPGTKATPAATLAAGGEGARTMTTTTTTTTWRRRGGGGAPRPVEEATGREPRAADDDSDSDSDSTPANAEKAGAEALEEFSKAGVPKVMLKPKVPP